MMNGCLFIPVSCVLALTCCVLTGDLYDAYFQPLVAPGWGHQSWAGQAFFWGLLPALILSFAACWRKRGTALGAILTLLGVVLVVLHFVPGGLRQAQADRCRELLDWEHGYPRQLLDYAEHHEGVFPLSLRELKWDPGCPCGRGGGYADEATYERSPDGKAYTLTCGSTHARPGQPGWTVRCATYRDPEVLPR